MTVRLDARATGLTYRTLDAGMNLRIPQRRDLGDRVVLSDLRGKAVLVTFLYTHCVDVCPLITANLRIVLQRLGPQERKVEIVAVSVDPRGDTRQSVATFLAAHHMTGRMKYLIGSAHELGPVS